MKPPFNVSQKHPAIQLLILVVFMLAGTLLSIIFAYFLGELIWGKSAVYANIFAEQEPSEASISFQKLLQMCQQVGLFMFPALLFAWCSNDGLRKFLGIKQWFGWKALCWSVVAIFAVSPFVAFLQTWNESITLPASLSHLESLMQTLESQAERITHLFLDTNSTTTLLLNIALMALLPAVAEELIFRGTLQNILSRWMRSKAGAVVITALIFSAFHFQFYGFFPRFVLGVVLGTLYAVSGSLWLPIIVHFLNNATAIILNFLEYNQKINFSASDFGQTDCFISVIISVLMVIFALWMVGRRTLPSAKNQGDF